MEATVELEYLRCRPGRRPGPRARPEPRGLPGGRPGLPPAMTRFNPVEGTGFGFMGVFKDKRPGNCNYR